MERAYTDFHIGRLLSALEDRGMTDRILVVVTADHGEEFGDHGAAVTPKLSTRKSCAYR
jgi:arylsulfatase A-like enzyme